MYPPIPLHFGRYASSKKVIMGKVIPQGSAVMIPTWYIHHDPNTWPDPWKFDPERFYDQKNNAYKSSPNLIPFSVGKRYCPGQSLAEKELFLFFVGMLKKFHFKLSGDVSLREDDGKKDWLAFNLPPKFQVLLERR